MALFDIFRNCIECGKSGLITKLNASGYCPNCSRKREEAKQNEEESRRIVESSPSSQLNKFKRRYIPRPFMYQGASRAYTYFVPISNVNRDLLYRVTQEEHFDATMKLSDDGNIYLLSDGIVIAQLSDRIAMATDWLNKKLPYICQFAEFTEGKERVVLHFFRDDENRFANRNCSIDKLSSCMSEEKQDSIACLEEGQRLFVEEDDNGKWYVRDVDYHEIGRMPAKFTKMHDDGTLLALFYDHCETKENANGDPKEIPYIRFYHE